jgi:hypothetical protein
MMTYPILILSFVYQTMGQAKKYVASLFGKLAILTVISVTFRSAASFTTILRSGLERCYAILAWRI